MTAVMLHLPVTHLTMKWKISHKWWIKRFLPLDLLFLKLPFAVRPGLTDSRVANLIVLSNCTKMKVEMITVQGSSVKQWVQAQYTGLVSWVIISTWLVEKCGQANVAWSKESVSNLSFFFPPCSAEKSKQHRDFYRLQGWSLSFIWHLVFF